MLKRWMDRIRDNKTWLVQSRLMDLGYWPNFLWRSGSYDFILGTIPAWMAASKESLRRFHATTLGD